MARRRRRSSSAIAISRRASPTARRRGSIAVWLAEVQRFLPAPHADHPPRHPARNGARAEGGRARSIRARPAAAGARAGELPAPGRGARLAADRRGAREGRRSPPPSSARCAHDSRRRKPRDLGTPASRSAPAHASSVAPVVHTSSTSTTIRRPARLAAPRRRRRAQRRHGRCPWRRLCRQVICGGVARARSSAATTGRPSRAARRTRLVEATGPGAPPVQRHGHHHVRVAEQVGGRPRRRAQAPPSSDARRT